MGSETVISPPILRAPPFPEGNADVSVPTPCETAPADPATLFAMVREARVGGRFWAAPASSDHHVGIVRRPLNTDHYPDVDPWSVLPHARRLEAHGNDEWIVLARVVGIAVEVLSPGRFGAPGDDAAKLDALAASALTAARWRDPFTGGPSTIETAVELLGKRWASFKLANSTTTSSRRRLLGTVGSRSPISPIVSKRSGATTIRMPSLWSQYPSPI